MQDIDPENSALMAAAKKTSEKQQAKRRKARLRQKQLIALEALLVIRWVLRYAEGVVKEQPWSPWLQISLIMFLVAGAFGWFLWVIQRTAEKSVEGTTRLVERMPIPMPMLVVHFLVFVILFVAYAWQLGFIEQIQADAEQTMNSVEQNLE